MKAKFEFCWWGLWFGFYWKWKDDGLHLKFAFIPLFPLHVVRLYKCPPCRAFNHLNCDGN